MRAALVWIGLVACGDPRPSSLWVSDRDARALVAFDAVDGALLERDPLPRPPTGAAFDDAGLLYTTDLERRAVLRHDMETDRCDDLVDDPDLLHEPLQIAFTEGHLLVFDRGLRTLLVLSPEGDAVRSIGGADIWAGHDLAAAPDHQVMIATSSSLHGEGMIQVWDWEQGELLERFGTPDQLGSAAGILRAANGDVYVADDLRDRVVRFSGVARELEVIASVEKPISLALREYDDQLFILGADGVSVVDREGGEAEPFIDRARAGLVSPRRIIWR